MHRNKKDFDGFSWHKRQHHLAYSIALAEQDPLLFHECMEMLDMIYAHAEEEFGKYSLLSIAGGYLESGEQFDGDFNVTTSRMPAADEFDRGALLVLTGYARETPLTATVSLLIHEETRIMFRH